MQIPKPVRHASALLLTIAALSTHAAESQPRLPSGALEARAPTERVTGTPGSMRITDRSCQAAPLHDVRRRIVDNATQQWIYFGSSIDEQSRLDPAELSTAGQMPRRGDGRMSPGDSARVARAIAGYWAAAPDSDWILQRQNENWNAEGAGARWRHAWSAAFISWVMCESGLGQPAQFRRAIAHHSYIDQAIQARDGRDSDSVYTAFDPGEAVIEPGDLLCRGSRPGYRNLAERRSHLGEGARTHCDIVVGVDNNTQKIMAIGGNVRGWVRMKVMHAVQDEGKPLRPLSDNGRVLFAHLKLKTPASALTGAD